MNFKGFLNTRKVLMALLLGSYVNGFSQNKPHGGGDIIHPIKGEELFSTSKSVPSTKNSRDTYVPHLGALLSPHEMANLPVRSMPDQTYRLMKALYGTLVFEDALQFHGIGRDGTRFTLVIRQLRSDLGNLPIRLALSLSFDGSSTPPIQGMVNYTELARSRPLVYTGDHFSEVVLSTKPHDLGAHIEFELGYDHSASLFTLKNLSLRATGRNSSLANYGISDGIVYGGMDTGGGR